jgi:ABC-type polysaccharide/polyol phosphate transport system ATPase subunit
MAQTPLVQLSNISVDLYSNSSDNFSFKKFLMSRQFLPKTISILENISLTIHKGDILGIEGSNGAGKTTLLSVIAGILPISKGKRVVSGRCLPLLGLGHVFHGDLDIRRNIELWSMSFNSNFLIDDNFINSIIQEAGLNATQDVLLRSLSSGMKSRLAFELAMRDSEDILLLDEVFSVGDAEFRARSGERIKSKLKKSGCAVIVSHDRDILEKNCTQIIRIKDRSTIELC